MVLLSITNKKNYDLIAGFLTNANLQFKQLNTETLKDIEVETIDLIIVDLKMGNTLNSYLSDLKNLQKSYIPVLLLLSQKQTIKPLTHSFFDDLIRLPVSETDFRIHINSHLKMRDKSLDEKYSRRKREQESIKNETAIRNKLNAITQPNGDIDSLELSEIIDADMLRSLMEDFYKLTGLLGAVLDKSGDILVAVGWQDICTKFHRCNLKQERIVLKVILFSQKV